MQRRLGIALSLAALLIGGATWYRLVSAARPSETLTIVGNSGGEEITYVEGPTIPDEQSSTSTNLTTTDLVGRQFMSDYLGLVSRGQATEESVNKLVDDFTSSISSLETYTPLQTENSVIVASSPESLTTYSKDLTAIYNKYNKLMSEETGGTSNLSDPESQEFKIAMTNIGSLTQKAAFELVSIAVPDVVAQEHRALVKNYLTLSNIFSGMGSLDSDPISAYAAFSKQEEVSNKVQDNILAIQKKLLASGVLFNSGQ